MFVGADDVLVQIGPAPPFRRRRRSSEAMGNVLGDVVIFVLRTGSEMDGEGAGLRIVGMARYVRALCSGLGFTLEH